MKNVNVVIIEGYLTKDPIYKQSKNGNSYIKFSFACNGTGSKSNKGESVSFIDVIAWEELAQSYYDKLKKGTGVRVIGQLSQWRWRDEENKYQSKFHVDAQHIELKIKKIKSPNFN